MWTATTSRRELLEIGISGLTEKIIKNVKKFDSLKQLTFLKNDTLNDIILCWDEKPLDELSLPILAITPHKESAEMFSALNASPQALSPFSAFCRVLSFDELNEYLERPTYSKFSKLIDAVTMLAMIEAQIHSDGRMKAGQISPAACRRTFSYVWASAMAANTPPTALADLPTRWLDIYRALNIDAFSENNRIGVSSAIPVLKTAMEVLGGLEPSSPMSMMISGIINRKSVWCEHAWLDLSASLPFRIPLAELARITREERGIFLQRALSERNSFEYVEAACGFLATQVGPNSLEHLDLLQSRSTPTTMFWYGLFATLQNPPALLAAYSGLGRRLSRDVRKLENLHEAPKADISFEEFKVLSRFNLDDFSRKISHSNEIEIEIVPLLTATFRFGRNQPIRDSIQIQQTLFNERPSMSDFTIAKISQAIAILNQTIAETASPNNKTTSAKRKPRKN
jgi:hypothetical protein